MLSRTVGATRVSVRAFSQLEKTACFDWHVNNGGKMVPFAGYELPIDYKGTSILKSHMHTRTEGCASVFDVSHMGQIRWHGKDAIDFLETMVVGDLKALDVDSACLSLVTNENGGILDDTVITKMDGCINMVVNGATKFDDMKHFDEYLAAYQAKGGDCSYEYYHEKQLLALQGPGAVDTLASYIDAADEKRLRTMPFMSAGDFTVAGIPARVTRCGYTGEDGFEISIEWDQAENLMDVLCSGETVLPAGLAARDSLRLEAGLCLYGHDLNEEITPNMGALMWTIPKSRRADKRFLGSETIIAQTAKGAVPKKRIGLMVEGGVARGKKSLCFFFCFYFASWF
eukprot:TRINITY_DN3064_c0_g2_i1.p1 TRINITY_DN3064_c0_g2~~TRINITY_DN3064_c0_g2_i1.p1  ORF type:complete len:342 (+),score=99.25 TRINITY_DN3064_c0_g2_i1:40-1065(+)